jgi:hypothetical protein
MKNFTLRSFIFTVILSWVALQTTEAGWVKRYTYTDINGVLVTNLYGTNINGVVVFPDAPLSVLGEPLPTASAGPYEFEFPASIFENWGSWTPGYLEPPETGNYTFWLYGDDETQLWITTDPADPLNATKRQLIAQVPGWAGVREWTKFPEQRSAPVYLEQGKQYFLEILHKDGTGGDALGLGWQTPSGRDERPLQTFYFQPTLNTNDATVVNGPFAAPILPPGATDFTIYDGMQAVLFADVNLPPPYTVAWRWNAADIPGATNTYYRFRARTSDNGAQIYVRVNGIQYGPLNLSVLADTAAPTVVSARVVPNNPTQLEVVFSEEVTSASATLTANYTLNAGTVQSATLQGDGRTVLLQTTLLLPGQVHTLTITGIQDMALPANTIATAQTSFVIAEGAITFRSWGFSRPDGIDPLRRWSNHYATNSSYASDKFIEERTITNTSYAWNLVPERQNFNGQMIGYLTPAETGYYKFAIASDDHSILYLGTSDQRSSKREICYYNGSTGQWNTGAQLANQQSALIYLEAGKAYFIEAVHRDGTGGDGVSVFWQTPSGPPLPTINQNVQSSTQPFLIPAQYLSTYASPSVSGAITYRIWDTLPTDLAGTGTGIYFNLRTWSATNSTAPSYTNNMFAEQRTLQKVGTATNATYGWNLVPLTDHYFGQIIGYLTAPETGPYHFGIASDDHSILYLGTSDQPSSKREICNYNGSTGQWNLGAQNNQRTTTAITLQAGQRYYIEAVWRDGTGGDGVTLAWYTPTMAANIGVWPPNPANNRAATEPYVIPYDYLSTFTTFGNVLLKTDLPSAISAAESTRPTLSVVADGTGPYIYQWLKGGVPIPGATASSYTLPYVRQADQSAAFSVVVSNNFSSVTSAVATLTVTTDSTKPTVASVGSLFSQIIEVRLSEPVTAATATDTGNYLLLNSAGGTVAVSSAVQDPADAAHITLQTALMPETDLMRLVVLNLADLSAAANVMDPQTNRFRANNFTSLTRVNNAQAYAASAAGGQIGMTAGGADIWGNSDQFVFLHKTVTGNFDYKVQGLALPLVNQWCKMGIMARAGTGANARNAYVAFTPVSPAQNTYTPQIRDITGGASTASADVGSPLNLGMQPGVPALRPNVVYPSWVRLQRIGNVIYYYYGITGTNWTYWTYYDSAGSLDGPLPAALEVGLALTSRDTARTVDGLMDSFMAVSDGALFLTIQPTNTTVGEGGTATFYAGAGGSTPYFYQWRKNNTDIPDATNTVLNLARVSFCTDNGAQIACRVSNGYGQSLTTASATLTVIQDTNRPTVAFYTQPKINLVGTEARLVFSEWVDANTSQDPNNYQIFTVPGNAPLAVAGAALQPDERTVILNTAAQTPGTTYRVVVNNVKDLACNPANDIAADTTEYFFYAGTAPQFAQRADGFVIMEAENAQLIDSTAGGDYFEPQTVRAGYSGTSYMVVTNGAGGSTAQGTGSTLWRTGARMVYHINFNRAGRHIVWIRGNVQNAADPGADDSVFVGFNDTVGVADETADYLVAMSTTPDNSGSGGWGNAWTWRSDRVNDTGRPDPLTITNTTAGLHRLIIWHREDGTFVDKIVIEAGDRAAGNTAAPAPCTDNGGLGQPETWDFIVPPPGAPAISIASPTNGQIFTAGNLDVTATITGPTPVVLVEYFQGTNLIGMATSAPYTITWANVPEGIYRLTARVTDILGYQTTSAAVQILEAGAVSLTDVTRPGDSIAIVNGSTPATQGVTNAIDNTTSKYLNFDLVDQGIPFVGPVGFVVTPSAGRTIVSKLRFYTADDNEARDPVNYVLEGSNDGTTWSLISSNVLATLPVGRNAGAAALNPVTQNVWHVAFANSTEYGSYRLQFFNVKGDNAANSMQLGEVELLGVIIEPPKLTVSAGAGGTVVITASQPGTLFSTTSLVPPVVWVNEGPVSGTVVITPAADVPNKYYRLSVP